MEKVIQLGSFDESDKDAEELKDEDIIAIAQRFDELSRLSSDPIFFFIGNCRGGGDLDLMLDLNARVISSKIPTVAIVLGNISSTAVLLTVSCKTRFSLASIMFTLHPVRLKLDISVAYIENGRLPRRVREKIGRWNSKMAALLKNRTELTRPEIKWILSLKGHAQYTAGQAAAVKIIHAILPSVQS